MIDIVQDFKLYEKYTQDKYVLVALYNSKDSILKIRVGNQLKSRVRNVGDELVWKSERGHTWLRNMLIKTKTKNDNIQSMVGEILSDVSKVMDNKIGNLAEKKIDKRPLVERCHCSLERKEGVFYLKFYLEDTIETMLVFDDRFRLVNYDIFDYQRRKFRKEKMLSIWHGDSRENVVFKPTGNFVMSLIENNSTTTQWKRFWNSPYLPSTINYFRNKFLEDAKKLNIIENKVGTPLFGPFIIDNKIKCLTLENSEYVPEEGEHTKTYASLLDEEKRIINGDMSIVKKWLELIKTIPLTDEAKQRWWNVFSFSIALYMAPVLADLGIDYSPFIVLVGPGGRGKSNIYAKFFVTSPWGIRDIKTDQSLKGTGVRLKPIMMGSKRPQLLDDIKEFSSRLQIFNMLKASVTSTDGCGIKMPRGKRDKTIEFSLLSRGLFITANKLDVDDDAMRQRIYAIPIPKEAFGENKFLLKNELSWLQQTHEGVGRAIIQTVENTSIDDLKKIIEGKEEQAKKDARKAHLERLLDIGKFIITQIYKKFDVEAPDLSEIKVFSQKGSVENIEYLDVEAILHSILTTMKVRIERKDYDIIDFINHCKNLGKTPDAFPTILEKFNSKGITFKKDTWDIVLFGPFKNTFNNEARRSRCRVSSLKDLGQKLEDIGVECEFEKEKILNVPVYSSTISSITKHGAQGITHKQNCIQLPLEFLEIEKVEEKKIKDMFD